jgi:hypothetical protein
MTAYDAEELRTRNLLRQRATERGYTQAQFDMLWCQYDLILQDTARRMVQIELMKFQRTRA